MCVALRRLTVRFVITLVIVTLLSIPLLGTPRPANAAIIGVTSTGDVGGTCPDPSNCTLRAAIAAAAPGDTITFGVTGTITLTSNTVLTIAKNLTISGPGVGSLAVDGNNATEVISISA